MTAVNRATTFLPVDEQTGQLVDLVAAMSERGISAEPVPAIVTGDGARHEIPRDIADMFVSILTLMAQGQAVTVMPLHRLLTTQEAADLLGVSRPTLIKSLERGDIPYELRGRHRRIKLADVLDYQEREAIQRRKALAQMQADAEEAGLYDLLDGPPPRMR